MPVLKYNSGFELKKALEKALTSTGDGAALLPYDLEPMLHEELLKQQPLAVLLNVGQANAKTHEYTLRSSHPQAWFEGETTPANPKNSVYQRKSVVLKIMRIWGSVTGFSRAVTKSFIDNLTAELEGSVEGVSNTLEYGTMWGSSTDLNWTGDTYQFSGVIPALFSEAATNVIDAGGDKITLDDLDQAFAKATSFRGVKGDPKLWMMGTRMRQVVDGLQTKVQIPLTQAVLADGKITMAAYSDVPILETDFIVPESSTSSPADLAGASAAGGTLTASTTYYYRIASITMYGEQVAAAQVSAATAGGQGTLNLTWTADPNALLYMIFRGTVNGQTKLIDIIPALTYDSAGTVNGSRTTYSDTGAKTATTIKPLESGEQNILLLNTNPSRGVEFLGKIDDDGRPVDEFFKMVELARVKDTFDYMLKGYLTQKNVYKNLHAMVRHAKLA